MSIEENKKVVVRFNKEFIEGGDTEILKEIVADDFINHTAAAYSSNDISGVIQFVAMMRKGFSDLRVDITEQIGEGDLVSSLKTISGTHLGEIMGKVPTGKKVTINVIDIVRIKNGKYADHWGRNDFMQVLQQLNSD